MGLKDKIVGVTALLYLSPIVGLLVELALARTFGASTLVDAYRIAALIVIQCGGLLTDVLLRNLVVPIVARSRVEGRVTQGWQLALASGLLLLMVVAAGAVLALAHLDAVLALLAPGLPAAAIGSGRVLITAALAALVLRVVTGLLAALLQTEGIFWTQALGQMLFNLVMLAAILTLGITWRAQALAGAMVVGVALGLTLHVGMTLRATRLHHPRSLVADIEELPARLRVALGMAVPLSAIVAFQQWQIFVVGRTLTTVGEGALALLGYAEKLMQIGALPALALTTVLFPTLAEAAARHDQAALAARFVQGLRYLIFTTALVTALVVVAAEPLVILLFRGSALTGTELGRLVDLCRIEAFMIPAVAVVMLWRQHLYGLRRFGAAALVYLAVALAHVLVLPFGAAIGGLLGVAATQLAIMATCDLVVCVAIARLLGIGVSRRAALDLLRLGAATGAAAVAAWATRTTLAPWLDAGALGQALGLALICLASACAHLAVGRWLGLAEAGQVLALLGGRARRVLARRTPLASS